MTQAVPYRHAVVLIDHKKAQIVRFNADAHHTRHLEAQTHDTGKHNSEIRDFHEFFGAVCDDVNGLEDVLIAGGHKAQHDFRHYVEGHRPALLKHIVGYETTDHPTEAQLIALARDVLVRHARMTP